MTLAYRIIYAAYCTGTHHKLAMDALLLLKNAHRDRWQKLFLKYADSFLEGSKAPDVRFRDFSNHVLHVDDNFWGGADDKAFVWYEKLVISLKNRDWRQAAYDAGVLSHYYTDPLQPFHTAQTEAENNIHRAFEWSVSRLYDELRAIGDKDFSDIRVTQDNNFDWLERLVRKGATRSRAYYDILVESYDFEKGVSNPPEGLNEESRRIIAELLRYAAVGLAGIFDRAFNESEIIPPHADLTIASVIAGLKMPVNWVVAKLEDREERKLVAEMYREYQETGRVEKTLPEDDRLVRDLYVEEILKPGKAGSLAEALENLRGIARRMREADVASEMREKAETHVEAIPSLAGTARSDVLDVKAPIEKAPSIGEKTALRLERIGIKTVEDLLSAEVKDISSRVNVRYITPAQVKSWQDQARLVCEVPGLRGYQAQLLVTVGCVSTEELILAEPEELLAQLLNYVNAGDGRRILRSSREPGIEQVKGWIAAAREFRTEKAA